MKRFDTEGSLEGIMFEWVRVRITLDGMIRNFPDIEEQELLLPLVRQWCEDHKSEFGYFSAGWHYYFEDEKDAMLFSLKWI